jgi:uncharacterized tellurite resistance protein B-like protein
MPSVSACARASCICRPRAEAVRSYPTDSPQAAARIVALAMLADGDLTRLELDALDDIDAHQQLGLAREQMHEVVHTFCDDLLSSVQLSWTDACRIDDATLANLMAEVLDPALRAKVLSLCVSVIHADGHVADGESIVLGAAVRHWELHRVLSNTEPITPS